MMMSMAKRRRDARACRACPAWPAASAPRPSRQPKKGKGKRRVSGNPAKAAQQAKAAQGEGRRDAGRNPFGNPDGEEVDYEKAAAALDLPKDFSKYPQVRPREPR